MNELDSKSLLTTMERAARAASAIQLAEFRERGPGWGDVKAAREFVSFVDVKSEQAIRVILESALPNTAFYGEETEQTLGDQATWVVDPLDGTTNYLSGYDHWSVSIALWQGGHPVLGLVFKPSNGELFTGIREKGAFRNGEQLRAAVPLDPEDALIATGTPYRSPDTTEAFFRTTKRVLSRCRDIRRTGSAALDLCYTAAGFFQGFWEMDLKPYDVAAGLLILSETNHATSTFAGNDYDAFRHRSLVTGRPSVFELLRGITQDEYGPID